MSRISPLLELGRPLVMGILNVTPDSFSDGGRFLEPDKAIDHALRMIGEGADIIDVGGESTRPGAEQIPAAVEIERVLPVLKGIRKASEVALSVDTSKAGVMVAACEADIDLINDVRALRLDGSLEAAARSGLPVCLMHMQGEPATMQKDPCYNDLLAEVETFFVDRIEALVKGGINKDRIILDVGFGFGKTPEHNLELISQLSRFDSLGCPLLVGLSRKSTIGKIVDDRLIGSLAGALAAVNHGARIVRVHDVADTVAALKVWQSMSDGCVVDWG